MSANHYPFPYKCPDCGSTNRLHKPYCKYEHVSLDRFEKPYIDILSVLSGNQAYMSAYDMEPRLDKLTLVQQVEELHEKNPWLEEHEDCLQRLLDENIVTREQSGLRLLSPDERSERIIPAFDPLQTIYECGPVDGCKDYAVYTMVSWCSLKEMSWEQTRNFVCEWLDESGAWARESWSESSKGQLVRSKKHVWSGDLGWGDMAETAKQKIEDAGVEPGISVSEKFGAEPGDYE